MKPEDLMNMFGGQSSAQEKPKGPVADNTERLRTNVANDRYEDIPYGDIDNKTLDPRAKESRRFGLYWVNNKINELVSKPVNEDTFIDELRTLLTMNPLRDGSDSEFDYASKIYANPKISQKNREDAIRLLSAHDFNMNYKASTLETVASLAVKNGDIGVLSSIAQSSNNKEYGNPFDYIDSRGNNLLHLAAEHHPELMPFLTRAGVKRETNNAGVDCLDIAVDRFVATANFNPNKAFDDFYITLSSLKKSNMLVSSDLSKYIDKFKLLNPAYSEGFKSMVTTIDKINVSSVKIPEFSELNTNLGAGYSTFGQIPTTGGLVLPGTFGLNSAVSDKRADKVFEASRNFVDLMDSETWLESNSSLKKKGFLKSIFGPRNEVTSDKIGSYSGLNALEKLSDSDIRAGVQSNTELLVNKLESNLKNLRDSNTDNHISRFYEESLSKIKSLSSSGSFDLTHAKQLDTLKNELLSFRTNIALDHMANVLKTGDISLRDIDISTPMKNKDGDTLFTYAAKTQNSKLLDFVLENNGNLHEINKNGDSLLHIAARSGNLEFINKLIGKFDGKSFTPIPPAKSVANPLLLNNEGKTFFDVMKESHSKEDYDNMMGSFLAKHPELSSVVKNLEWDVPFWSLDHAQQAHMEHTLNSDMPQLGVNNPKLLQDAEWFKKPYKLGSAHTDAEAVEHYAELNETIKNITHALRNDNLDKDTARDMQHALSEHLDNLPADKLLGMTVDYMSSADKDRAELHRINMDLMNPMLGPKEKVELEKSKAAVNDYMTLKGDIIEKVSNSIMSQLSEGSESRKEAIYQSFDKYALTTGGDVTKVLAGLSVLSTENEKHHAIFTKLEDRISKITSQKYADMTANYNSDSSINTPKPDSNR